MNEINRLKIDLHNLCKWSKDWLMLFNVDTFRVMYVGFNNINVNYKMNGRLNFCKR